jgi:hypothetical protein
MSTEIRRKIKQNLFVQKSTRRKGITGSFQGEILVFEISHNLDKPKQYKFLLNNLIYLYC